MNIYLFLIWQPLSSWYLQCLQHLWELYSPSYPFEFSGSAPFCRNKALLICKLDKESVFRNTALISSWIKLTKIAPIAHSYKKKMTDSPLMAMRWLWDSPLVWIIFTLQTFYSMKYFYFSICNKRAQKHELR